MAVMFSELGGTGLIAARGADAMNFLHAQLTSDLAGLPLQRTQYSGYCSPKGRLLATFLVWRAEDEILLQLPESLRASVQTIRSGGLHLDAATLNAVVASVLILLAVAVIVEAIRAVTGGRVETARTASP